MTQWYLIYGKAIKPCLASFCKIFDPLEKKSMHFTLGSSSVIISWILSKIQSIEELRWLTFSLQARPGKFCSSLDLSNLAVNTIIFNTRKKVLFDRDIRSLRLTRWNMETFKSLCRNAKNNEEAVRKCLGLLRNFKLDLLIHMHADNNLLQCLQDIFRSFLRCNKLYQRDNLQEAPEVRVQELIFAAANHDLHKVEGFLLPVRTLTKIQVVIFKRLYQLLHIQSPTRFFNVSTSFSQKPHRHQSIDVLFVIDRTPLHIFAVLIATMDIVRIDESFNIETSIRILFNSAYIDLLPNKIDLENLRFALDVVKVTTLCGANVTVLHAGHASNILLISATLPLTFSVMGARNSRSPHMKFWFISMRHLNPKISAKMTMNQNLTLGFVAYPMPSATSEPSSKATS